MFYFFLVMIENWRSEYYPVILLGFNHDNLLPGKLEPQINILYTNHMQESLYDNTEDNNSVRAKILLIEDEELIRDLYAEALQDAGFDLVIVGDGESGLEKWKQSDFNLLITDIGLPGISGWDVIETIRQKNHRVPIIIISGWGTQIQLARGKELNVNYVLAKPIDIFSLIAIIKECLPKSFQNSL
jgi:CheY-like chemotaxis protein